MSGSAPGSPARSFGRQPVHDAATPSTHTENSELRSQGDIYLIWSTDTSVIGFAQQADLHDGTATVREALEFSALLRQPLHYSKKEKLLYVEGILDSLDLRQYENVLIGDDNSGLGVEQKKRVTVSSIETTA